MGRNDRICQIAAEYVEQRKFSGIEWHVECRGTTLSRSRAGYADFELQTPIPEQAIYRIFSMTKPVVSVMALILIEQGKLRLGDDLASFDERFRNMQVLLPNGQIQPARRPIRVEDLLMHRAGFTYGFIAGCHVAPLYQERLPRHVPVALDEMIARLAEIPLAYHPGAMFRYSVAIDVLAHVLERVSGRRIDELLDAHIFPPLGMRKTGFHVPGDQLEALMPIYEGKPNPLNPRERILARAHIDGMYPTNRPEFLRRGSHGLFSTLDDYAKFARFLIAGRSEEGQVILSRKMLDMMRTNRIPPEQLPLRVGSNVLRGYGWGLGVRVMINQGQALSLTGKGEFGWESAATTYFWVDPAEEMIGVIMTQHLGASTQLTDDMRTAAYQMLD